MPLLQWNPWLSYDYVTVAKCPKRAAWGTGTLLSPARFNEVREALGSTILFLLPGRAKGGSLPPLRHRVCPDGPTVRAVRAKSSARMAPPSKASRRWAENSHEAMKVPLKNSLSNMSTFLDCPPPSTLFCFSTVGFPFNQRRSRKQGGRARKTLCQPDSSAPQSADKTSGSKPLR